MVKPTPKQIEKARVEVEKLSSELAELNKKLTVARRVAATLAVNMNSPARPEDLAFNDVRAIFAAHKIDRIWTDQLLSALHKLGWDEFRGLRNDKAPHALTSHELYRMLKTKRIYPRSVWKRVNEQERISHRGFLRQQFEPAREEETFKISGRSLPI